MKHLGYLHSQEYPSFLFFIEENQFFLGPKLYKMNSNFLRNKSNDNFDEYFFKNLKRLIKINKTYKIKKSFFKSKHQVINSV